MKSNIGQIDKNIRLVFAVVLIAFVAGGVITGIKAIIGSILAILLFTTALIRTCPLYGLAGISTSEDLNDTKTDKEIDP